jgi:hypothetical protein
MRFRRRFRDDWEHELFGVVFEGFNPTATEFGCATHGDTIKKPPEIVKPQAVLL